MCVCVCVCLSVCVSACLCGHRLRYMVYLQPVIEAQIGTTISVRLPYYKCSRKEPKPYSNF